MLFRSEQEKLRDKARSGEAGLHSGYLKPTMSVMDLTSMPRPSVLLRDAAVRGCGVVSPRQLLVQQLQLQFRLIAGKEAPRELLEAALTSTVGAEE